MKRTLLRALSVATLILAVSAPAGTVGAAPGDTTDTLSIAALGAGQTLTLQVTGRGGVPDNAGAVVLNVTSTNATTDSFITVHPTGTNRPNASSLNTEPGQDTPNLVIAKIGDNGQIDLYNDTGTGDLIADVVGWYPTNTDYTPTNPARILDTRTGNGAPATALTARDTVTLQVTGRGGVPDNAGAVVLNVTSTNATTDSFITVHPTGTNRPNASSLNTEPGQDTPNLVIAKIGDNGQIDLYNDTGTGDLIADVVGWYPTNTDYTPTNPARILDTRTGNGAPATALTARDTVTLQVTGRGGVPDNAGAVVLNVTSTNATTDSFITVHPTGTNRPNASSLNTEPGQDTPNLVIAKIGDNGQIDLYNDTGTGDLIADVVGWYPTNTDYTPTNPARILDTRTGNGVPGLPPGSTGPGPNPPPGGTVDASALTAANTGPAPGTNLTPSGTVTVTTNGAVIDGLAINGCLRIAASNVTVRNTRVTCNSYNQVNTGLTNTLIENVEFIGQGTNATGLFTYSPTTVRRSHFHGHADAFFVHGAGQVLIEQNYFHDLNATNGHHKDHIQVVQGNNITIRNNRIVADPTDNAAIFGQSALGNVNNITITGNHITGGLWSIWCVDYAGYTINNCSITNNTIVRNSYSYGPITHPNRPGLTSTCNRFHDGALATVGHNPNASQTQSPNPCP